MKKEVCKQKEYDLHNAQTSSPGTHQELNKEPLVHDGHIMQGSADGKIVIIGLDNQ